MDKLAPVHPGEVLQEEFLNPMGLSQNRIALSMRMPARRINEIVHGKRRVTAGVNPLWQTVQEYKAASASWCFSWCFCS